MTITPMESSSSVSSVLGDDQDPTSQMYLAVKGRKRKPSAKLLDVLQEDVVEPVIVHQSSFRLPTTVLTSGAPELSLQCAVAETIMNEEDTEWILYPRASPVLIEKIPLHVWRMSATSSRKPPAGQRSATTPKRKVASPPPQPTAAVITEEEEEDRVEAKSEPIFSEFKPEEIGDEKPVDETTVSSDHLLAESKRKRGRPFKGQEKPIEERLLMETSKIRRLIEDILRKNSSNTMCLKLRQIVNDLDSVLQENERSMRPASRALILTDDGCHILLVKFELEKRGVFWALPGGGKEEGESFEDALARELREEVGLSTTNYTIGPHIWTREHLNENFGEYNGQREQVYLVRVGAKFEPSPSLSWDQLNAENIFEIRWWSMEELAAAKDDVTEGGSIWCPRDIWELVSGIVENGPPNSPLEIGV